MLASIRAFLWRLANLRRPARSEASFDAELRFHLEMETEANIRQGMTPDEAHRRAMVALGGLEQAKEEHREGRGFRLLANFAQDLRYAFRTYRKNPGFVAVVVLTLALGIGINVGFFSAFNAVLLMPLRVRDPDRLARIQLGGTRDGQVAANLSYPEYLMVRKGNLLLDGLAAFENTSVRDPEARFGRSLVELISENYFSVLGGHIARGRGFADEEMRVPGAFPVLILSDVAWRRRYDADPRIVGKTIALNDVTFTIIGVGEPGFGGMSAPDFWAPIMMHAVMRPGSTLDDGKQALRPMLVARLPRGVSLEQFRSRLLTVTANVLPAGRTIASRFSLETLGKRGKLNDLRRSDGFAAILAIAVAFGLVLLIACANVASLLLARAGARRREIAVRLSLGASRPRLVLQLLTENSILALVSGLLSLLLAQKAAAFMVLNALPFNLDIPLDWHVVLVALVVSLGAAFFSGFTPAMESTRTDLVSAMRGESVSLFGRLNSARLRNRLVVVQVAVCLILLTGTGLLLPSALRASAGNQGFQSDNVFLVSVDMGQYGQENFNRVETLAERLRHIPSVGNLARIPSFLVGSGTRYWSTEINGRALPYRYATPQFFQTMRIPLVRGRSFTEEEMLNESPVAVISETAAATFFPGEEPIGKAVPLRASTLPVKAGSRETVWRSAANGASEVIGVVSDVVYHNSVEKPDLNCVYLPSRPDHPANTTILVRLEGNPGPALAGIRTEAATIFGKPEKVRINALSDEIQHDSAGLTFLTKLTTSLGAIALLLTVLGLYSMMSYVVSRRTSEIGIRMAMGAQPRSVLWMILARGLELTIAGTVIGIPLAAGIYRVLGSLVFKVSLFDPAVFAAVSAVLLVVCLAAAYIPARRATRLDPLVALRHE